MQKVTVRYPEDFAAYVRRAAKQRGVREPSVWRELVALGIQRREANDGLLNTVFSLTVQNLCTCRRIAGRIDESLIDLANEDARRALESEELL